MKRKQPDIQELNADQILAEYNQILAQQRPEVPGEITQEFLEHGRENFGTNPVDTMARNAVACVGVRNAALDVEQANQVSHVFLNSLKPSHIRATNQESSGRCWMFAGLNVFRYLLYNALNLENFEFSETYLFFYDKLERANYMIQYFIDHPDATPEERAAQLMLREYYGDGGYWNFFANLVDKYGLVPKDAMDETFHSGWTDDMNQVLRERILSCINQIVKIQQNKNPNQARMEQLRRETMETVYNCLVKFLGQPPTKFNWFFQDTAKESHAIVGLTPKKFQAIVLGGTINVSDFVTLANMPGKEFYQTYTIRNCNNMVGGNGCTILNVPSHELRKYAAMSIHKGLPVWFAGDVSKGFGYHKSVLNEDLYNTDLLFGKPHKWDKEDKLKFGYTEGNHAMTLTGVNYDEHHAPTSWQVENSWGYFDHELLGLDGFLTMSNSWFEDNLIQIAVHKNFLTRSMQSKLEQTPIVLEPWDFMAPALKVDSVNLKRAQQTQ